MIVVSSKNRLGGAKRAPLPCARQNGSGFHGQPRVSFALERCTLVSGFHGTAPAALSLVSCSPSNRQSNTFKSWAPADNDAVLALQSHGGDNYIYGDRAGNPYVQSSVCAGLCDGSRLVRGDMPLYLVHDPMASRRSVRRPAVGAAHHHRLHIQPRLLGGTGPSSTSGYYRSVAAIVCRWI
jgi:hypothetical protein